VTLVRGKWDLTLSNADIRTEGRGEKTMRTGRRLAVRNILVVCAAGGASLAGLIAPLRAIAAWPRTAFDAKTPKELTDAMYKGAQFEKSDAVSILAPDLAENGGIVPITVVANLPEVESIVILAEGNPRTLTSAYTLGKRARGPISVRVKLAKTQNVTAIVRAQGKTYSATRKITVSVGGCGG
jgi:sulfur-oxidizing protein SoxY